MRRGGKQQQIQQQPRRPKNLKKCELGSSCPYKNEYQHQLEFCHDSNPLNFSNNNRNAGSGTAAFSGRGSKLGGMDIENPEIQRRLLLEAKNMQSRHTDLQKCDTFICTTCHCTVKISALEDHMKSHDQIGYRLPSSSSTSSSTNRNISNGILDHSIKSEQDQEYEKSLLADMEIQEQQRSEERRLRDEKMMIEERKLLKEAMAESIRQAQIAARDEAIAKLIPEPDMHNSTADEQVITIRFSLPSGKRVSRKFSLRCGKIQYAFDFLKTVDELAIREVEVSEELMLSSPIGKISNTNINASSRNNSSSSSNGQASSSPVATTTINPWPWALRHAVRLGEGSRAKDILYQDIDGPLTFLDGHITMNCSLIVVEDSRPPTTISQEHNSIKNVIDKKNSIAPALETAKEAVIQGKDSKGRDDSSTGNSNTTRGILYHNSEATTTHTVDPKYMKVVEVSSSSTTLSNATGSSSTITIPNRKRMHSNFHNGNSKCNNSSKSTEVIELLDSPNHENIEQNAWNNKEIESSRGAGSNRPVKTTAVTKGNSMSIHKPGSMQSYFPSTSVASASLHHTPVSYTKKQKTSDVVDLTDT